MRQGKSKGTEKEKSGPLKGYFSRAERMEEQFSTLDFVFYDEYGDSVFIQRVCN
jgi:hypothetical protein